MAKNSDAGEQKNETERRNWAGAVGRDVSASAQAAFVRAGFSDPALVLHWNDIAGPEIARMARPVRFSQKDGVLILQAEPAAALFLGHEARALAGRINAYLGRAAVQRLKFVQSPLASRPAVQAPARPEAMIKNSDPAARYQGPEKLAKALKSLARWRKSAD